MSIPARKTGAINLKAQPQAETELALGRRRQIRKGARNRREVVQGSDGVVRIQHHRSHAGPRVGELRRVGEVECLGFELGLHSLRHPKRPEETQVDVP